MIILINEAIDELPPNHSGSDFDGIEVTMMKIFHHGLGVPCVISVSAMRKPSAVVPSRHLFCASAVGCLSFTTLVHFHFRNPVQGLTSSTAVARLQHPHLVLF